MCVCVGACVCVCSACFRVGGRKGEREKEEVVTAHLRTVETQLAELTVKEFLFVSAFSFFF